jgi:pimeloyl-ACP methyl ester carboxylesterase
VGTKAWKIALLCSQWMACSLATASAPNIERTITVSRVDGSPLQLFITLPEPAMAKVPLVLIIDGSGCVSSKREDFRADYIAIPARVGRAVATLAVEKPGVEPGAQWGSKCSETFLRYYSIDQRVLDHLRAIQHLRKHASWWNGEMYLFGWSDGGLIGAQVASYTPEVKRAVLGGTGGGLPMTTQFERYIMCAPDRAKNPEACVANLRKQFQEIRDNPAPLKTWSGEDNSYRTWATRMDAVEYNLIKDLKIPVLIAHGALDRDGTPVESARELMRLLEADGQTHVEYWEIPSMGHGIGNVEPVRREKLRSAMFNWLFAQPVGAGGPPTFGL